MKDKEIQILDAALHLFNKSGIQGTATSTIAQKAGVSNGTLFHYFKTKTSLIYALYQKVKNDQVDQILEGTDDISNISERINLICTQWIRCAMNNENDYKFCNQFENSVYFDTKSANIEKRLIKKFAEISETGIHQKVLTFMPPDMFYEVTKSNIIGIVGYLKKNPVKYRTPEFMRNILDFYWKSVGKN